MSLLAVDMGSSSCKAVAFSDEGRVLAQESCSYSPESQQPGWAEMDPDKFWQAFRAVTRAVATETNEPVEVLAISSHGETFIPVDSRQQPVGPAILNIDNRAVAEANWLADTLGASSHFRDHRADRALDVSHPEDFVDARAPARCIFLCKLFSRVTLRTYFPGSACPLYRLLPRIPISRL